MKAFGSVVLVGVGLLLLLEMTRQNRALAASNSQSLLYSTLLPGSAGMLAALNGTYSNSAASAAAAGRTSINNSGAAAPIGSYLSPSYYYQPLGGS